MNNKWDSLVMTVIIFSCQTSGSLFQRKGGNFMLKDLYTKLDKLYETLQDLDEPAEVQAVCEDIRRVQNTIAELRG